MTLTIYRYRCPYCDNGDMGEAVGRCLHCHGAGKITEEQAGGIPREELTTLPLPPGVMGASCGDCAYRLGSPEREANGAQLPDDAPFWCHTGMDITADGHYEPAGYFDAPGRKSYPLGGLLCHGWWALKTGRPLPKRGYRDVKPVRDGHRPQAAG
ncbi:hypothetical protein ABZT26_25595 [Streptomyces sp. NPDC005395]|uniref:hypothetical protein n=1 Tax=Streptomyces sp. NPDC005395 TaxID=3157042 RepID=UPI0033BE5F44